MWVSKRAPVSVYMRWKTVVGRQSVTVEGALKGGGPWGGEEQDGVSLVGDGLGSVELGVVGDDPVDQLEEGAVVLGGGGGELADQVVQVVEP